MLVKDPPSKHCLESSALAVFQELAKRSLQVQSVQYAEKNAKSTGVKTTIHR